MLSASEANNDGIEKLIYDDCRGCGGGNSPYDRISEMQSENIRALLERFERAITERYYEVTRISAYSRDGLMGDCGRNRSNLRISIELRCNDTSGMESGSSAIANSQPVPTQPGFHRDYDRHPRIEISGLEDWV